MNVEKSPNRLYLQPFSSTSAGGQICPFSTEEQGIIYFHSFSLLIPENMWKRDY